MELTRRQTLFGLSALAGHALFPDVLESFARLPHEAGTDTWTPELVSAAQGAVLAEVAETIVPKTATPGAKDARVHVFVDSALKRCAHGGSAAGCRRRARQSGRRLHGAAIRGARGAAQGHRWPDLRAAARSDARRLLHLGSRRHRGAGLHRGARRVPRLHRFEAGAESVGDVTTDFDAIVVGSGISGGWAAKELTEAGLRTLVLERGRIVEHVKDYPTANLDPWQLPHGNRPTQQDLADYPVQKDLYLFGQDSKHFFVKDVDHPYNAVKRVPLVSRLPGGRAIAALGAPLLPVERPRLRGQREGRRRRRLADPLQGPRAVVRPRRVVHRRQRRERRPAAAARRQAAAAVRDELHRAAPARSAERRSFTDRRLISSRAAVLSQPHNGRGKCQSRNLCHRGCPYGAYFSSNSSTLPAVLR